MTSLKVNLPQISTRYRSGMKYNSSIATDSTEQARHDKKGTDQLNMLQWNKDCRLVLSSFKMI